MSVVHLVRTGIDDPICNRVPRAIAMCVGDILLVTCKRCLKAGHTPLGEEVKPSPELMKALDTLLNLDKPEEKE